MQSIISAEIQEYMLQKTGFKLYGSLPSISEAGVLAINLYQNVITKNLVIAELHAESKAESFREHLDAYRKGKIIIGLTTNNPIYFCIDHYNDDPNPGVFDVWEYDIRSKKEGSIGSYDCVTAIDAINRFSSSLGFKGVCRSPHFHMFAYNKAKSHLSIHPNTTPNRYAK